MRITTEALVLKTLPHSDSRDVGVLYSRGQGRFSVLMPAAGKRRRRPAPLTVIEGNVSFSSTSSMHKQYAYETAEPFSGISLSPLKSAQALFIADFLDRLLAESPGEPLLWDHIVSRLRHFSAMKRGAADFSILFLLSLLPFAGITPITDNYSPGSFFDLRAGTYTSFRPTHNDVLEGTEAGMPRILSRLNSRTAPIVCRSGKRRMEIIEGILRYYRIHFPTVAKVRAHLILSQLF